MRASSRVDPGMATHTGADARPAAAGTWLILPALVAFVPIVTWRLLATELPRPAASGLPLLSSLVVVLLLERAFPRHRAWNRRPDGKDLLLLVANRFVDFAVLGGTVALVAAGGESLRLGVGWPQAWPVPVQVLVGITIGELLRYAMHRYSHRLGFWWRVHRTHHEPDRMYALNGPRLHPLNYLWVTAAHSMPMLLLGAPLEVVLVTMNLTGLFVILQHANLRLRFDGLNQVLATPDVHRLHHARGAGERGVNYAIVLVLIDRLFGTFEPAREVAADGIGPTDPRAGGV